MDVRIIFPNAENYIVLGKKQLRRLNRVENIVSLWLDETEILHISSAIIDAYLYPGTKIYVNTYVQPQMQAHAIPFYPANADVLDLMGKDPNILKTAGSTLAREARNILEGRLDAISFEEEARISSGVSTEISRTHELIKKTETDAAEETQEKYTEGG